MKKIKIIEGRRCPKCGKIENQINRGHTAAGSQRCRCKDCGANYTLDPKRHAYSEETVKTALKIYFSGVSGRGVGKAMGFSKANVYNWLKKTENGNMEK